MKIEVRSREVVFHVELSQAEGVGLYWAISDVAETVSERANHPRRKPLYALFDELYKAGAADMSREPS